MKPEIHATIVVHRSNLSWFISVIYASPRYAGRRILWFDLIEVSKLHMEISMRFLVELINRGWENKYQQGLGVKRVFR